MTEIWKPIKGYEGIYEVSNAGRIKRLQREIQCDTSRVTTEYSITIKEKILSPIRIGSSNKKYLAVALRDSKGNRKIFKIHRLVASSFIPNPYNLPHIDHIDGNKENNSVSNLEWVTERENYRRAYITGLFNPKGENNGNTRLTSEEVKEIRQIYVKGDHVYGARALGRRYGVSGTTIDRIVSRKGWNYD